ncbi:MAG: tRNA lysidine(34) synthetase TilS, partial [Bacteroidales bacterium]|nr:tRNA lysidine(34) synthetase TilS [Bacteroidales bacterium]
LENYGIIKTNINNFFTNPVMDYDKIKGAIYLRNRRDGDKIMLAGRGFTSTVKKLLNEKIPLNKRDTLVFLEDDEGLIFVEGFGPAQRVCCDRSTKRLILIDICDK